MREEERYPVRVVDRSTGYNDWKGVPSETPTESGCHIRCTLPRRHLLIYRPEGTGLRKVCVPQDPPTQRSPRSMRGLFVRRIFNDRRSGAYWGISVRGDGKEDGVKEVAPTSDSRGYLKEGRGVRPMVWQP